MKQLVFLKGLPGSGKTTYAKSLKGYKRVNKDDLRSMLDDGKWSKSNEKFIIQIRDAIISRAMIEGYDIVVDDTNFEGKHLETIKEIINFHNSVAEIGNNFEKYELEEVFIDTPLEECIIRDLSKERIENNRVVGEKIIKEMYNRYLKKEPETKPKDPNLPDAIIVDIDGTLAKKCDRNIFDYTKVGNDDVYWDIVRLVKRYSSNNNAEVIIMSGRDDSCHKQTMDWLDRNYIPCHDIFMRKTGDKRKDAIVKKELYEENIKGKFNIDFVLDDRDQVVKMWREEGLRCLQVQEGNF